MANRITLTPKEMAAIRALEKLARSWPKSLTVYSWAGSLCALKKGQDGRLCLLDADLRGIPNDGGDPGPEEVDQFPVIVEEQE